MSKTAASLILYFLAISLVVLGTRVLGAEQRVKDGDAPFCTRLDSLEAFVLKAARQGFLSFNDPACVRLKAGARLDVTGDVAKLGEVEVYAVTVHGAGGDVDGFTLSNRIEDVPRLPAR